jgi:hypothetical protein
LYQVKRFLSHSTMALVEAGLVALLVVGLIAGTAFAGKGGNGGGGKPSGGGGTIALEVMDEDGVANQGDNITFHLGTSAAKPFVGLNCFQGGALVYSKSVGYFADYPWDQWFTLSSMSWSSGAADCTAKLYTTKDGTRTTVLASTTFAVAP